MKKKSTSLIMPFFSFQSENNDNHGQQQSSEAPPLAKKEKRNRLLNHLRTLKTKPEAHIAKLPVLGFNSGTYDLNAAKRYLVPELLESNVGFVVKQDNCYTVLESEPLRFLDIHRFLSAGTSLDAFLKSFNCRLEKGHFPYEWFTSLDKLESPSLPPRDAFYSSLKQQELSVEEYNECQRVWCEYGMRTMRDYLVWCNNRDVEPFVEAAEKLADLWRDKGVDLFKQALSLPGVSYNLLMAQAKQAGAVFALYKDEALHVKK